MEKLPYLAAFQFQGVVSMANNSRVQVEGIYFDVLVVEQ